MRNDATPRLHWTQRIALVVHNLHAARRSNDFSFFKSLQAHTLVDGTDHVAILHSILGDGADSVLSTLDNLNAGIAYVHQDAFKAVYDGTKSTMYKADNSPSSRRSLLRVDICQQRDMADHAIGKTTNSAINLIHSQPAHCQDAVANAWITGTTIVADAVCVCLSEMDHVEDNMDDFIRLEYSWSSIQNSVDAAISALRGIFSLMATPLPPVTLPIPASRSRTMSVSSNISEGGTSARGRQSSIASGFGLFKRAFNGHNNMLPPVPAHLQSLSSDTSSRGLRQSMNAACPTRLPNPSDHANMMHSSNMCIPGASAHETSRTSLGPFEEESNCFSSPFDMENKDAEKAGKLRSASEDMMQLESLDPLSPSTTLVDYIKTPAPLSLRRLSDAFGMSSSPLQT